MNNNRLSTSYILCIVWFFGLGGLHRLYNGKIGTGLLWLFTWGVFGVGQFVDLFIIPSMVEEHDLKLRARLGVSATGVPLSQSSIAATVIQPAKDKLTVQIVKAAEARGGKISVTQAVMDTEASFVEVEEVLKDLVKIGYVSVENDYITGIVMYRFNEL
ncbi:TM2 domain-containing protein [Kamptonema formosum]|uniref:TM2 domain-containing protein n=1 Tax=Kamptonema formosum TaxID=331992 RepID=UPI00034AA085|nr:TM2 domain-containing protein [Oscillatoria sp. PCC 10802]